MLGCAGAPQQHLSYLVVQAESVLPVTHPLDDPVVIGVRTGEFPEILDSRRFRAGVVPCPVDTIFYPSHCYTS